MLGSSPIELIAGQAIGRIISRCPFRLRTEAGNTPVGT